MESRETQSQNAGSFVSAVQSCAGHCPGTSRTTPITCEGACSSFSAYLLSRHPDPALRRIFLRTLERVRRPLGAAFLLVALAAGSSALAGEVSRSTPTYDLKIAEPPAAKAGELATATIRVVPKKPYKMNLEFPLKLKLGGPDSVAPRELQLGVKQAAKLSKDELLLKPAFKLLKGGSHAIKGTLRFSVCTDAQCEIKQEAISFTTSAK